MLPGAAVVPSGQETPTNTKHAPASQQARKHGLGVQLVAPAMMNPLHCAAVATSEQLPSDLQQTNPGGHWLGVQVLPGAGVEPVGHWPLNMKHEPSDLQQARVQRLGVQIAPGVNERFGGTGHCDGGAMKQKPSSVQQAPVHGSGKQTFPAAGVELGGHARPTNRKQVPVESQHAV